jgi:vacuolar-type H+-ATPase subunit I/STV1
MEYSVALDRIKQGLGDNAGDIVAAIADRVSTLEQDVSLWKRRHGTVESQLTSFKESVEGKDVKEYISALKQEIEKNKGKITELEKQVTDATAKLEQEKTDAIAALEKDKTDAIARLEQEKTEALAKIEQYERDILYTTAATKAGVNQDALLSLVKAGLLPDLSVDGEAVSVGGKAIDEYLAEPGREWVKSALYVQISKDDSGSSPPPVPTGGTNGSANIPSSPVEDVFKSIGVFIPGK